jgi:(2Fe-2S) ferredoxin
MINKILKLTGIQSQEDRDNKLYNDLLRHEAQIGGTLFGKLPEGGRREFFCLDQYTWVWHEEWKDKSGKHQSRTTRYNVRPDSIVKIQDGKQYQQISKDEAGRFYDAVLAYERKVKRELYHIA